jgi:hypothetical protein
MLNGSKRKDRQTWSKMLEQEKAPTGTGLGGIWLRLSADEGYFSGFEWR